MVSWGAATGATSYTVQYGTVSGTYSAVWSTSATSPTTVTGLTNGTTYYFRVKAVNSTGNGLSTAEASATPTGPGHFQIVSANPGTTSVTLSWTASANATSYAVKYGTSSGSYGTTASSSATSPYTVTGLTGGTLYYFMVTATASSTTIDADQEVNAAPGTVWSLYGSPNISNTAVGNAFAMALDPTTTPNGVIIGSVNQSTSKAFVNRYSSGSWAVVGGADASTTNGTYLSTCVAPSGPSNAGYVYASFRDPGGATANGLTVRQFDGTSWTTVGSAGFTGAIDYSMCAVGSAGNIWVAYRLTSNDPYIVEWTGASWSAATNLSSGTVGPQFQIAFDTSVSPRSLCRLACRYRK